MKRFVTKLLIFSCIIGIPFLVLNQVYKNTNYYKNSNVMYELRVHPDNITLLNLGNSHEMNGFVYENYYNGVANNFATSSQPFYYSYQVLVNAEDSIEDEAIVLIPISYYDWYYDYVELYTNRETYNNRYYGYLKPFQLLNFDLERYFEVGVFPLLTAKEDFCYIYNDIPEPDKEAINTKIVSNIDYYASALYSIWCNEVMELGANKNEIYKDNLSWFVKIVEYCKEQNYTPVIIVSPVTRQVTETFGDDFMADFDAKNQVIKDMYPEVLFLDYSRDSEFCDNLNYFQDANHLNYEGANLYTQRVLNDLVYYGILQEKDLK